MRKNLHLTYTENWWPVKYCMHSTRDRGVLSLLARGGGGGGGGFQLVPSQSLKVVHIQPFRGHARVTFIKDHFLTCQLAHSAFFFFVFFSLFSFSFSFFRINSVLSSKSVDRRSASSKGRE